MSKAWMRQRFKIPPGWRIEDWLEWRIDHNPINNWVRAKADLDPCTKTSEWLWWWIEDQFKALAGMKERE